MFSLEVRGRDSLGMTYRAVDLIGDFGEVPTPAKPELVKPDAPLAAPPPEWRLTLPHRELGDSDVYECYDLSPTSTGTRSMMFKVGRDEPLSRAGVRNEIRLLKQLGAMTLTYAEQLCFPRLLEVAEARYLCYELIDQKKFDARTHIEVKERVPRPYFVCEWLPVTLTEVARWAPDRSQPVAFVLRLAVACARALDTLHRAGYAHRCVAPDNLALRLHEHRAWPQLERCVVLCNLSLARKWQRPPRKVVPFVGTQRFASARAHRLREQGPADDFTSLVYVIIQLLGLKLPWAKSVNKASTIASLKERHEQWHIWTKIPREVRHQLETLSQQTAFELVDVDDLCTQFQEAVKRRSQGADVFPAWIPHDNADNAETDPDNQYPFLLAHV